MRLTATPNMPTTMYIQPPHASDSSPGSVTAKSRQSTTPTKKQKTLTFSFGKPTNFRLAVLLKSTSIGVTNIKAERKRGKPSAVASNNTFSPFIWAFPATSTAEHKPKKTNIMTARAIIVMSLCCLIVLSNWSIVFPFIK